MRNLYSASREAAQKLVVSGCVLDHTDHLPRKESRRPKVLSVSGVDPYLLPRAIDTDGTVIYLILLRIKTEFPDGVRVADWHFLSPWQHHISWDCEPAQLVLPSDRHLYEKFFDSDLLEILEGRTRLTRDRDVVGLLAGIAYYEQIPNLSEASDDRAELIISIDGGETVKARIPLETHRRRRLNYGVRRGKPLFSRTKVVSMPPQVSDDAKDDPSTDRSHQIEQRRELEQPLRRHKIAKQG